MAYPPVSVLKSKRQSSWSQTASAAVFNLNVKLDLVGGFIRDLVCSVCAVRRVRVCVTVCVLHGHVHI